MIPSEEATHVQRRHSAANSLARGRILALPIPTRNLTWNTDADLAIRRNSRFHLRSSRSGSRRRAMRRFEFVMHVWKWQRWITRCLIRGQFRYIMITIAMTGEFSSVPSLGRIWRADGADWRSAFVLAKNPCTAMKNTCRDFYNLIIRLIISVWLMHVMPHDVYVCACACVRAGLFVCYATLDCSLIRWHEILRILWSQVKMEGINEM